ncbi:geranylgeranylglyceryl/heptaprenylglyceryl phosphate synthase [Pseudotenacibaculum haliotis]|uniref:Geranylgeranylglyceryl phosphate synthase n=1 Tax=Pseudotenacibaculum haliotis TaxID=1862138 RepID=A0ABW5LW41_9FLAO
MTVYQEILEAKESGKKLLAVLIDPEKIEIQSIHSFIQQVNQSMATHIFVGGSTDVHNQTEQVVIEIKKYTTLPVLLFPGSAQQVTSKADGILFLSLLSGRNPEYLIEQQIASALTVQKSGLEVIPTGYILIDGGKQTSVERISRTQPLAQNNYELILKTSLAGQFSGKKLIYLEAGSGAINPVGVVAINCVKSEIQIPLIVGGGIKNINQLNNAYNAGADMVVIGTAFEKDPTFFNELKKETINENFR